MKDENTQPNMDINQTKAQDFSDFEDLLTSFGTDIDTFFKECEEQPKKNCSEDELADIHAFFHPEITQLNHGDVKSLSEYMEATGNVIFNVRGGWGTSPDDAIRLGGNYVALEYALLPIIGEQEGLRFVKRTLQRLVTGSDGRYFDLLTVKYERPDGEIIHTNVYFDLSPFED